MLKYKTLSKFQWIKQDQTEGHCAQLEIASRALLEVFEHISSEHSWRTSSVGYMHSKKVWLTKTLHTTEKLVPSGLESFQTEVNV